MNFEDKYKEVMTKIEVDDEMKSRILTNIANKDFEEKHSSFLDLFTFKKVAIAFACLVIAIFTFNRLNITKDNSVSVSNEIEVVDSLDSLNEKVGFELKELSNVPFEINETIYTSYWNQMAEITYIGQDNTLTYRKAIGNDDISGDYNEYKLIKVIDINDTSITLKGNSQAYSLAIWHDDTYTYSLSFTEGIELSFWENLLSD